MFFPPVIFFVLAGNFLIDALVYLLISLIFYKRIRLKLYFKTVLMIWGIGFSGDIIGAFYNGPCNLDHGIEKMREHGIMRLTKGRSANYVIQNVHVGIQSKGSHRGSPRGEKSK